MQVNPESNDKKKVIVPEEIAKSKEYFNHELKKAKITCRAWLLGKEGTRDKLFGSVDKKVGDTHFVIKGKRYFINYEELKEGKKAYYYDTDVMNAVGSLSFKDNIPQKVMPNQAESMLRDDVVRLFMGKGGLPTVYFLVAFIVVAIALAGMMYSVSSLQTYQKTDATQKAQIASYQSENLELKSTIDRLEAFIQSKGLTP